MLYQIEQSRARGLWKKTKRKLADLIRSASFTEVGVALDCSANWQTRETKSAIVQLVDGASNLRGIEFLPYNRLAGAKYAKLGRTYSPGFDESRDPDVSSVIS